MNKKLILGTAFILTGVIILDKGFAALDLVMGRLRSGTFEPWSFIAGIIFIAVMLFGSYLILKGNEYLK